MQGERPGSLSSRLSAAAASFVLAAACLAQQPLSPSPSPTPTVTPSGSSKTHVVDVDGVTGQVTVPDGRPFLVVLPLDSVIVNVTRADTIHFAYTIKLTSSDAISPYYSVVGAGDVRGGTALSSLSVVPTPTALPTPSLATGAGSAKSVGDLAVAFQKVAMATGIVKKYFADALAAAVSTERAITTSMPPTGGWPPNVDSESKAFSSSSTQINDNIGLLRMGIDEIRQGIVNLEADPKVTDADVKSLTKLSDGLDKLAVDLTSVADANLKANAEVQRWRRLIATNPRATVSSSFVLDRQSKRYTFTITRQAVGTLAAAASADTPPSGTGATGDTLATVVVESHSLSRFILSAGVAALYLPHSDSFAIVDQLDGTTVKHFVRRTATDSFRFRPVVTLGTYFSPVDDLDPARGYRWFVFGGTEIASSIEHYLLGVGIDSPMGITVGVSAASYKKTRLGIGYTENQEVPSGTDGKALVASAPTSTRQSIGIAIVVAFRPAIFSLFQKAQKPS